jgi:hypothetical protein
MIVAITTAISNVVTRPALQTAYKAELLHNSGANNTVVDKVMYQCHYRRLLVFLCNISLEEQTRLSATMFKNQTC